MASADIDLFDKSLSIATDQEEKIAQSRKKTDAVILKDGYEQVVGFMLKDELFGIDILHVEEIIKPVDYTHVPNAESFVLGVINLRGKIIPIVDLRIKFGLGKKPINTESRFVIVSINDYNVGFMVDKIEKVYYIDKKNIEPTPPNIPQTIEKYVKGVGKLHDKIMTLLNMRELLEEGGSLN